MKIVRRFGVFQLVSADAEEQILVFEYQADLESEAVQYAESRARQSYIVGQPQQAYTVLPLICVEE
jgi:hypothetical protein